MSEVQPVLSDPEHERICAIDAYLRELIIVRDDLPLSREQVNKVRDGMFAFFMDDGHKLPNECSPENDGKSLSVLTHVEAVAHLSELIIRQIFPSD